jgi:hypothetical protein
MHKGDNNDDDSNNKRYYKCGHTQLFHYPQDREIKRPTRFVFPFKMRLFSLIACLYALNVVQRGSVVHPLLS